jgi:hypothetical protein
MTGTIIINHQSTRTRLNFRTIGCVLMCFIPYLPCGLSSCNVSCVLSLKVLGYSYTDVVVGLSRS